MTRACVVLLGSFLAAGWAGAIEPSELAAPGVCAGDDLVVGPATPKSSRAVDDSTTSPQEESASSNPTGGDASTDGGALTHLSPVQVAAGDLPGSGAGTIAPPVAPAFAGPGACDDPGSGCSTRVFDDPDPDPGCGFPGSPCP